MPSKIITNPVGGWQFEGVITHPGAVLREDFLTPMGISAHRLALRLARFFGTSAEFWVNLQVAHDLSKARCEAGRAIQREVEPLDVEGAA